MVSSAVRAISSNRVIFRCKASGQRRRCFSKSLRIGLNNSLACLGHHEMWSSVWVLSSQASIAQTPGVQFFTVVLLDSICLHWSWLVKTHNQCSLNSAMEYKPTLTVSALERHEKSAPLFREVQLFQVHWRNPSARPWRHL